MTRSEPAKNPREDFRERAMVNRGRGERRTGRRDRSWRYGLIDCRPWRRGKYRGGWGFIPEVEL